MERGQFSNGVDQLIDARLSYDSGDRAQSPVTGPALRLAEPEQLRLPFVVGRSWIGPVLRRDPELADIHWCLLPPALRPEQLPALPGAPEQAAILAVEPLSEREREVLRHVSGLLRYAEVATEMCVSVSTVRAYLKRIYRKLCGGPPRRGTDAEGRDQQRPAEIGRRQHLTLTCATAATMRGGEGPWRPGLHRFNIPFPVWEMRIYGPLGGRWRSQVAGQLRRTRPLTVR